MKKLKAENHQLKQMYAELGQQHQLQQEIITKR
jgi:hypothetical protein